MKYLLVFMAVFAITLGSPTATFFQTSFAQETVADIPETQPVAESGETAIVARGCTKI